MLQAAQCVYVEVRGSIMAIHEPELSSFWNYPQQHAI